MPDARPTPLVYFQLDVVDLGLVHRWVADGYLPTLSRLLADGCRAGLVGPEHITEHGTNMTILSGVSRSRHGYYFFRQLRPGTYDLVPTRPACGAAPPFWAHLRGRGVRVAVFNARDAELVRGLDGVQIANLAIHQARLTAAPPATEPTSLLPRVQRVLGRTEVPSEINLTGGPAADRRDARRLLRLVEQKGTLYRQILRGDRFDLVVAGFTEAHTAGHRFWPYVRAADGAGGAANLATALREVYRAIDRQMGLLLEALPSPVNVAVTSPHGLTDLYPVDGLMHGFCRQLGHEVPRAAASAGGPLGLARRLLPLALRERLGAQLPMRFQERVLAASFREGTDWSRTTAFSIPVLNTGAVRVNLRGREPSGTVAPGRDYDELLDRIENDLRLLIDAATGEPVVGEIVRTSDTYGSDPPNPLPDLLIAFRPHTHFLDHVIHPRAVLTPRRPRYVRDNDEDVRGFFIAAGPDVRGRGELGDRSALDVAPTLLALLGISDVASLAGRPVPEILGESARG